MYLFESDRTNPTSYYRSYLQSFFGIQCEILGSGCNHQPRDASDKSNEKLNPLQMMEKMQAQIHARRQSGTGYIKCQTNPFGTAFDMNCKLCIYHQLACTQRNSQYLLWLFRNFKQYPNITKYYWHHSKVWKKDFIEEALRFIDDETREISYLDKQNIGDVLCHVNFFRLRHWKSFIFTGWLEELAFLIWNWYAFQFRLTAVNINEKSQLDVEPVLALFICLFNGLEILKKNGKCSQRYGNKIKRIENKVHNNTHKHIIAYYSHKLSQNPFLPRSAFIEMFLNRRIGAEGKAITQIQSKKWSRQFSNQECAASKCKIKRGPKGKNRKSFIKCKRCKIAVYCSKQCAKFDWNHGNHRNYCERFRIPSS